MRGLYSPHWVAHLTQMLDRIYNTPTPLSAGSRFRSDAFTWQVDDGARDFVLNAPSARIMQVLFRSTKVNFFYDQVFIKKQLSPEPT